MQEFCERWLADLVVPARRENTAITHARLLRLYIYPHIGGVKLSTLRPLHLTQLYADLTARVIGELQFAWCTARCTQRSPRR